MWIAAEPVPRDAVAPPSRFCEFAPSEIRLVADSMQEFHRQFKSQLKPEDALFSGIRVADRAARNWQRFAAHVGAQTACPDD
ncbi:MAG: hypothetical protein JNG89_04625 [Planctomycetaceae bacterium]|nr:hypothetical protein [Planctomycetaceae bacterium]